MKNSDIRPGRERFRLLIAYDGRQFAGWQSQAHGNTIQDRIHRALADLEEVDCRLHGAGRTDAGVHAEGQSAHMDVRQRRMSGVQWRDALNAHLPPEIRILRATRAAPGFHARYSAKGKRYRYQIVTGPVLPPFLLGRAWHLRGRDLGESMIRIAPLLGGKHDFRSFAANRGKKESKTVRTVRITARRTRYGVALHFEADGFLYRMVRLMTGAVAAAARGRLTELDLQALLRGEGQCRFCAPPDGLFLERVFY